MAGIRGIGRCALGAVYNWFSAVFLVKIHGYRVEPEEPATVLRCLPGVRAACVVVEEDSGRPFLGALVVTDRPASEVRSEAATRLPA